MENGPLENAAMICAGVAVAAVRNLSGDDAELLSQIMMVISDFMSLILAQKALLTLDDNTDGQKEYNNEHDSTDKSAGDAEDGKQADKTDNGQGG